MREHRLSIWSDSSEVGFARERGTEELWGFCASCYYADVCRAGCTWTAHVLFGRPGNNPYCHHRVLELAKEGKRERVVKVEEAPGRPFDAGRFALLLEPIDGKGTPVVQEPPPPRPASEIIPAQTDRVPPSLTLCRGCEQYVHPGTTRCPFCDAGTSGPLPAASFDHGGEVTPSRITRYRCSPISPAIEAGRISMWIA